VRDLVVALGIGPATIVGHSLGGGVAMQFAYQFPERAERLALVSSGGLGRDVHVMLRAATLPGSEWVLPLLASRPALAVGSKIARDLQRLGITFATDGREMARGHASLNDAETRGAFIQAMRASIDITGQRVQGNDRLYLATQLPLLIVWGARDRIIPLEHGRLAHELVPGSRFEVFDRAGHFLYLDEPDRFVALLEQWMTSTTPGIADEEQFRDLMLHPGG
jgi:pimeloyl-ACP methyl ester carboxylesterase